MRITHIFFVILYQYLARRRRTKQYYFCHIFLICIRGINSGVCVGKRVSGSQTAARNFFLFCDEKIKMPLKNAKVEYAHLFLLL